MTFPYTPEVRVVRDAALAQIAADDAAGRLGAHRRRDWRREWDLPPEPATVARTVWEEAVADRVGEYDPDDLDVPHPGGSRWERNVLGEAHRG